MTLTLQYCKSIRNYLLLSYCVKDKWIISKTDVNTMREAIVQFSKNGELSFPCAFLSIGEIRRTKSQVYTLMLGSRNIPVYCLMGDFGCGSGGCTLVMKTDGTKVKERKFA